MGQYPGYAEFGTIQVFDSAGGEVRQARFDTDDLYRFECPLNGRPGDVFKVVITDDLRSVWSLFDAAHAEVGRRLEHRGADRPRLRHRRGRP